MKIFDIGAANKIHNNFYDYGAVKFTKNYKKVDIICPVHGIFQQTPQHHVKDGRGCRKCQYDKLRNLFSGSADDFIRKAKDVHGKKYDYSMVNYINTDAKVRILCGIHGEFEQSPYKHIQEKQGCPGCKGNKISLTKRDSINKFLNKSRAIHGEKYDYSNVEYVNMHRKVKIGCKQHGAFYIKPSNHIFCKNGCPDCGYNVSKQEREWLDALEIPKEWRQRVVTVAGRRFKVDAYDKSNKIIYEYFGRFWHGHPDYFSPGDVNPRNGETYGNLYKKTLDKLEYLKSHGFTVIEKWG